MIIYKNNLLLLDNFYCQNKNLLTLCTQTGEKVYLTNFKSTVVSTQATADYEPLTTSARYFDRSNLSQEPNEFS